ncbi:glycosyltransferase family 2 protein [Pedobacter cryoconitis]|nr:hypothetical protein [Pedobacter cryoconitis]
MTIWRRNNIEEQIRALLSQTIVPTAIWIYHCESNVLPDFTLCDKFPLVKYQMNTDDLGYFGRFSLALHVKTPYVYILDDDVIPSAGWLENCMKLCLAKNSIISATGRIVPKDNFKPERPKGRKKQYIRKYFVGDNYDEYAENYSVANTNVDFGCNSWFFKSEWLTYFWGIRPFTTTTGEDIHLSVSCLLLGGIKTMVPLQDVINVSGNIRKHYGYDDFATWKKKGFIEERENLFKYWIENRGWKPMNW